MRLPWSNKFSTGETESFKYSELLEPYVKGIDLSIESIILSHKAHLSNYSIELRTYISELDLAVSSQSTHKPQNSPAFKVINIFFESILRVKDVRSYLNADDTTLKTDIFTEQDKYALINTIAIKTYFKDELVVSILGKLDEMVLNLTNLFRGNRDGLVKFLNDLKIKSRSHSGEPGKSMLGTYYILRCVLNILNEETLSAFSSYLDEKDEDFRFSRRVNSEKRHQES